MEPIRKRFFVNGVPSPALAVHAAYLKPAYKLLDEVRRQMSAGVEQYQRTLTLEDGTNLGASRRHGQTEIHINIHRHAGGQKKSGAFCVWEGNTEQYAQILDWIMSSAVMDTTGKFIYARGDDEEVPNDAELHPERRPGAGTVYAFNAETMAQIGSFKLDSAGLSYVEVSIDTRSNRFFAPFYPGGGTAHALAYWSPGDMVYQQMTVDDSVVYSPVNGGQFAIDGFAVTLLRRDPDFHIKPVPFFLCAYDGTTLARAGELELPTDNNQISVAGSADAGLVASYAHPTGTFPNTNQQITFTSVINGTASVPATLSSEALGVSHAFVMDNAGQKAWLSLAGWRDPDVSEYDFALWTYSAAAGWSQVEIDGLETRPFANTFGGLHGGKLVVHDPVTDAVAFLLPDASGVHVFNAKDCFGDPMPAFFVRLAPPMPVYAARACQLYGGVLIFEVIAEQYTYPRYTTIGRLKIGRLFQHKIEQL
ncbi:hypothetical protein [Aromatoleum anaerobium]|uniref:Uncharacterized protein n=1 Tax=Aromatoleum anaerobium TaxID=182180 RepID=A0ABX1PNS6_9RHOO|nr:hypothetical protein [Aromatoleum anaerobium]MCK0507894.1 hypothetical protein [Aromatoleum anaerobium]